MRAITGRRASDNAVDRSGFDRAAAGDGGRGKPDKFPDRKPRPGWRVIPGGIKVAALVAGLVVMSLVNAPQVPATDTVDLVIDDMGELV